MRPALAALSLALTAGCTTTLPAPPAPEATLFEPAADGSQAFDAATARARASGRPLIVVLGANWCHDSRALAGWLETPRFRQLVSENFEMVFIDVGRPQAGEGRNMAIPARFGLSQLPSTPALLVIAPDGALLNRDSALKWGNAASRSAGAIYAELAAFARHSPGG